MELSYFGAKVIHPKTMQPAISSNPQIPIYIRNTFNPTFRGTRIFTVSTTESGDGDKCVCGFSSVENIALINVEGTGMMGVPGVANRLFGTLEKMHVNVILISQASSEHSITFATRQDHVTRAKEALEEEFRREIDANHITEIQVKQPCSIIAAVGDGMSNVSGVSGRFFSALGQAKINILAISQGCSERNISAVVRTEESTRALRAIHAAFRLSHTTVRVSIVGMQNNEIGASLLKLLQGQRDKLRTIFDIDLQVCAVVPSSSVGQIVRLTVDQPGTNDSITSMAYKDAITGASLEEPTVSFKDQTHQIATVETGGLDSLLGFLFQDECTHHVLFDCTSDALVGRMHASWLRSGIHIVTANNTGLAGPKEQLDEIRQAEKAHGKQSAHYLREVTVGGALPVITTLHSLLDSGDRIRRMDGIMSVSMSFIMYRISPPPRGTACFEFDEIYTMGAFQADNDMNEPRLFSEAIMEAVALGLMEVDPRLDLNNNYTARNLMVLAQELGVEENVSVASIQESSEKLLELCLAGVANSQVDYQAISSGAFDDAVKRRVDAARKRGCVLRHISSVNVRDRSIGIKIVEVPDNHLWALNPPSCECVRFFTQRHEKYPLIIQGPSAGADSTASALLAALLHLMKEKVGPRRVTLSRRGSASLLGLSNENLKGLE
jgi:bifunctional aspartokinase / homoserine dehydrogenase 1